MGIKIHSEVGIMKKKNNRIIIHLKKVGYSCGTCFNLHYNRRSVVQNLFPAKISVFPIPQQSTSIKSTTMYFQLISELRNNSSTKYAQNWVDNEVSAPKKSTGTKLLTTLP